MKKRIFIILILFVFVLINQFEIRAQADRTPVYVHGLGGTQAGWANWQMLFTAERQMTAGSNRLYVSENGVVNFANQVRTFAPPNNNSIIFGHSTGGVVARHIERTPNIVVPFGGIITAGAPLDGARISNNLANGQTANFILNGVDKVLKGPVRQFGPLQGALYQVNNHLFKSLAQLYVNRILNNSQGGATSTDLAEGSAYINNGMRGQASAIPKIHIYGNENSPVLWRIASVASTWADGELVNVTQVAYDVCMAAKNTHIGLAALNPFLAIQYFQVADGWSISGNWIKSGSESGWNDLIGASIPSSITTFSQVMDYDQFTQCMSAYAGTQATYAQYMQCQEQSTFTVSYTSYSPINGRSDGFIKAPSQTGFNSAWSNNATRIEALGVNHLEMRNHVEMRRIYNLIFNGQAGANAFFNTPPRN